MDKLDYIKHKIDVIEEKLDKGLQSIATNSADISWLKGHLKITIGFFLTLVSSVIIYYITN